MSTIFINPVLLIGCVAVLGLWVGTWLARVVHALPLALEAAWQMQLADAQDDAAVAPDAAATTVKAADFNQGPADSPAAPTLSAPVPCQSCGTVARGWRTWPGLSAIFAPSHCRVCGQRFPRSARIIEWTTALVFAGCAWRYGYATPLLFASVFCAVLIVLAFIDAQTTLLPDVLTLPLLWLGLLVNSGDGWVPLSYAVWGAALGYGGLWLVYHAFRLVTGREGMGYGDFKLLAALGAWLGVALLPWILLAASLSGVVVGLTLRAAGRAQAGQPLPFGPYLSAAGIIALLWFSDFPG